MSYDLLRQNLIARFSDSEIRTLCFSLEIDYDNIDGDSKADKCRELILFLQRRDQIKGLIQYCQRERPALNWAALLDDSSDSTAKLSASLLADAPANSPSSSQAAKRPPCPYPGMAAFGESGTQAFPFYGRETEIQQLLLKLRQHPLVLVIGPSGCGKSSFVKAGVIPALHTSTMWDSGEQVSSDWRTIVMRPGTTPLSTLREKWPESQQANPTVDEVNSRKRTLLVVDQFEETFTLAQAESIPFQNELIRVAGVARCYIVLTMRADLFADLMTSPMWPVVESHRLELPPLSKDALRAAIVRPAETVNVVLDPVLVEKIVDEAQGEPGILPFVQETMLLLWDKLEHRYLSQDVYHELVQSYAPAQTTNRKLTGLQVAMALRADTALADLPAAQRIFAWRIFTRLIQFGEGRPDTRRQQPVSSLRSTDDDRTLFNSALSSLVRQRVLTLSGSDDDKESSRETLVDLAHESLIHGWPKLDDWIAEHRAGEQTRRRLEAKATEWIRLGRGQGGLLDSVEMAEADAWLSSPQANELGVSPELSAFISRSRVAIGDAARAAQAARRWRQLVFGLLGLGLAAGLAALGYRESVRRTIASPLSPISAGPATLGMSAPRTELGEQPLRTVVMGAYLIEQYEVTNEQYRACVGQIGGFTLGPCSPPQIMRERYADPQFANHPVVGITPPQAADYCDWIGRRLPTTSEWERAARGAVGHKWPWGDNDPVPGQVQLPLETVPAVPTSTVAVDDMPLSATSDGMPIYHMADNVMEWVAVDPATSATLATPDKFGVVGGAFDSSFDSLSAITLSGPENMGESIGFRCAAQ